MSDTTPALTRDEQPELGWPRVVPFVVQASVIGLLLFWLYERSLRGIVYTWQTDGNWSHGWLVPAFSLYFLWVHREAIRTAPRRASVIGLIVLLAGLALYYAAIIYQYAYPGRVSLIFTLMGIVWFTCGWRIIRLTWLPIAFLLFAIPLPESYYFKFTLPLRRIASQLAGILLGLLPDVYTEVQGVVIDYQHGPRISSLNVEEACSGMRLIMALCSLGVAMAYLAERPLWQRVIMVLCCIPIAIICNALRVIITGVLHIYELENWSEGTAHELIGMGMLPIALGMFALVGWILANLFVEDEPATEAATD